MKLLTLIRHAKSDWNNDLSDFDRPLNQRGLNDAPIVGKYLSTNIPKPDLIISSPAVRADSTAKIIAKELNYPGEKIVSQDELYLCSISEYIEILIEQHIKVNHIIIVSHNPGTTGFANILTNSNINNVPTCGIVHIKLDIVKWEEIEPGLGKLLMFTYPKQIKE